MRIRLTLAFIFVALASILAVALVAQRSTSTQVRAFMFRGGMLGLERTVNDLEAFYQLHGTWEGAERLLNPPRVPHRPGMIPPHLRLTDAEGRVIADSSGAPPGDRLPTTTLDAAIPLVVDGQTVGYLVPEGGLVPPPNAEKALLQRLNRSALWAALLAVLIAAALALLLSQRLLRPVQALTQAARALAAGDLTQRVPVEGGDELATLAHTFNQMAEALQQAEQNRRQLTADIAHELRTPLAVQRAQLEALQDGVYDLTPDNLAPILEQNRLLTRLVEDLRTLTLADSGQLELNRVPTDLKALVERAIARFAPQAEDKHLKVAFHHPEESIIVQVDPMRLEQILSNLLDNALRHTPEGGQIELHLSAEENTLRLSIHDTGPGIPPEALPHIFERFYRADQSRSRTEGGTGLGLSIARQLARAHGGDLTAANHPNGGAIFTLTLPSTNQTDNLTDEQTK